MKNDGKISPQTLSMLRVSFWPRYGAATLRALARELISREDLADEHIVQNAVAPGKVPADDSIQEAEKKADSLVSECRDAEIRILSYLDDEYPKELRRITDAPPIIYMRGNTSVLRRQCVAVVGTRDCSKFGARWAWEIGRMLSASGICVVSGLAKGIDKAAHEGALEGEGSTAAILAHGLHTVTPAENRELSDRILSAEGALVSEHPPGVPPRRPEFVRRNRIQSGCSLASIIVESAEKGGAMHQARFTKDQGRKLLVVRPDRDLVEKYDFQMEGGTCLIETMDAHPLGDGDDLKEFIGTLINSSGGNGDNGDKGSSPGFEQLGLL